jgi:hypothetical protein
MVLNIIPVDFGVSAQLTAAKPQLSTIVGTPYYMSPVCKFDKVEMSFFQHFTIRKLLVAVLIQVKRTYGVWACFVER